ncbi:M20 metallopeptidase family protein [Microlunatus soli]|uniref:Hippurate hydrolase n=1 Tax=Microlunatus soli TaxID=630515 RepID=A0A1H1TLK0_9ACTN|nr:M20 family metallopeptidase [Microlunatus soli]SDS61088.1 hippurate hydrolase [Microlunatus soli]
MTDGVLTAIDFKPEARTIHPDLVALRRELHQIPERGNDLPQTQARVLAALEGLGLEVSTGRSITSVVAVLRGKGPVPAGVDRPTVLLRGDMDALPVIEETGLEFASTNGMMHACGHDLHTAGLVGAARLLSAHIDELPGDVIFMFQPGEESPGGAEPMIAEGLLEVTGRRPDAAYGIHVMAEDPYNTFALRPNALMAGCHELTITVTGRGGHGSQPARSVDPVPVAAEIVLALQSYVTRRVSVFDPVVITVGQIHAGTAMNIIPDTATLNASVRVLSKDSSAQLAVDLPKLADGIASAHGCTAETAFEVVYPVTVNDPTETAWVIEKLTALHGAERVRLMPEPRMGSEDFSLVLEQVPGAFIFLGAHPGPVTENAPTNHSARAAFDDGVLADQAATLAQLAADKISTLAAERGAG